MPCTLIPATGPIFNRVLPFYVTDSISWLPYVNGFVVVSLAGLSIWGWKAHHRLNTFPVVLGLVSTLLVANVLITGSDLQMSFARWYLSLPLSVGG
jgi:hypothetical protein